MKYTKQYSTNSAYDADNARIKPNVSLILEDDSVKFNPFRISGRVAKAGTILLAKTATPTEKIFVPYESWDSTTYSAYTPIGVVVVPFTHTPDNTVRVMSLKNMDLTSPDSGSVTQNGNYTKNSFYWGGANLDAGLTKYNKIPNIDPANQNSGTVGLTDWVRIPSDYLTGGTASTLDEGTKYYNGTESGRFGISPYVTNDWKSYEALLIYKASNLNCMLDYNGSGNTATILAKDNAVSTAWQTASTIVNNSGGTNVHAPAQCCWRYSTVGTSQGEWYLPACGELLYINPRYNDINNALKKLMAADSTNAVRLWNYGDSSTSVFGTWLWSSTEFSVARARHVNVYSGDVYGFNKNFSSTLNRVRAFAAFTV